MKKLLLSTLATTAALTLCATAVSADTTTAGDVTTLDSELTIKFTGENANHGEGPYKGRLSLPWVPKNLKFGDQEISYGPTASYNLKTEKGKENFVIVNDDRSTTSPEGPSKAGSVWSLKAKMGEFVSTDTAAEKLPLGNSYSFDLGALEKYNMGTVATADGKDIIPADPNHFNPTSGNPLTNNILQDWGVAGVPADINFTATRVVLTDSSNEEEIMALPTARAGADVVKEGYASKLANQKVEFVNLPTSALDKEFKNTITWTLTRDITK